MNWSYCKEYTKFAIELGNKIISIIEIHFKSFFIQFSIGSYKNIKIYVSENIVLSFLKVFFRISADILVAQYFNIVRPEVRSSNLDSIVNFEVQKRTEFFSF